MPKLRKIVFIRRDSAGKATHFRFAGNTHDTPLAAAIRMADKGLIKDVHATHGKKIDPYLRSDRDSNKENNLSEIGKTTKHRKRR